MFYDRSNQSKRVSRNLILKPVWDLALTDCRRAKGSEIILEVPDYEIDAVSAGAGGDKARKVTDHIKYWT